MVLDGIARKVSLILMVFAILGWITFDVGFGLRIHNFNSSDADVNPLHRDFFPYWCFLIGAAFLYIVHLVHLFANHGLTQYLTIFFMAPYFIGAGGVLYMNGLFISYAVEMLTGILGDSEIDNYYWIVVEFAGTSASVLFYWISMMLWPCFQKNKRSGYYEY